MRTTIFVSNSIYLALAMLGLHCCPGFFLVVEIGGLLSSCSAQASLAVGYGLQGEQA